MASLSDSSLLPVIRKYLDTLLKVFPSEKGIELWHSMTQDSSLNDKVVECFTEWVTSNTDAILSQNNELLNGDIIYPGTKRICIKMSVIFADEKHHTANWQYLLLLLKKINPESEANQKLLELRNSGKVDADAAINDLFQGVLADMKKLDTSVKGDPSALFTHMVASGAVTKVMKKVSNGVETGQFDVSSLFATMGKLMITMSDAEKSKSAEAESKAKAK